MAWYLVKHRDNFALAAMKTEVAVLWVMTPCSDAVGYQRFVGHCCLHLQGEVSGAGKERRGEMEEDGRSKVLRNATSILHDVTTQKTQIGTVMKLCARWR
jgi:hypothetical protein